MCEFISWVERRGKVYFLTGKALFKEEGQKWVKDNGVSPYDYCGHGTIRRWFGIDTGDGKDKECTDFRQPSNFPTPVAEAIKMGKMRGFPFPKGLLRAPLYADYEAKRAPLYADYEAKRDTLYADYKAKRAPLDADYEAKLDALYAEQWDLFAIIKNRTKAWC